MSSLVVADRWGKPQPAPLAQEFRKGPPPAQMGEKFGNWAGRDLSFMTLPGGAILQFDLSRLTLNDYRGMRDHYQVNICQALLLFLIGQLDWKVESSNKAQATKLEDNLREIYPQLMRGVATSYWSGFGPMAVEVDNNPLRSAIEVVKVKDLIPEECFINWKIVEGWAPPMRVKPKLRVFDGINQIGMPTIPVDNSLWSTLLMESGDHYGRKLLRPAFAPWFFSMLIHLYSNRYFERFGEPVPIGRAPFDENLEGPGGTTINGREVMEQMLTSLRNRSVVVLPNDRTPRDLGGSGGGGSNDYEWDISYLESQMRGADFERYMQRLDEEISLAMFTPLLITRTADVGSYNLGVGHMQAYLWMLNSLATDLTIDINRLLKRLKDWNFGPNAPDATFTHRAMGKENVETLRGIVDQSIRKGDIKADIEELSAAVGLTFEDTSQMWDPVDVAKIAAATDPAADPNALPAKPGSPPPKPDTRGPRGRGSSTPADSRGVGDKRPSGRKVAASVAEGVVRAFEEGTFGTGFSVHIPPIDGRLERSLESWVTDVADAGPGAFEGPKDFLARLESVADQGLRDLGIV